MLLVTLSSCDQQFTESDLYGVYSPMNYKNTLDTIQIKSGGIYHRKVYDRNGNLALEMSGKWNIKGRNEIQFYSFFQNLDRDIFQFPELLSDTTGGLSATLESKENTIQFCIGHYQGKNCYRKNK